MYSAFKRKTPARLARARRVRSRDYAARSRPRLEPLEGRVVLSFAAPPEFVAGPKPVALATGDFNGDGRPDLAAANGNGQVTVLLNTGGAFHDPVAFPSGGPSAVSIAGCVVAGIVLLGAEKPIVLCAVDWIGIANEGHDHFREVLAQAAGTTRDRVAVHALHQHDAPGCDFTAERLILHKNSVQYRVHKAEEALGHPLDDDRLHVELALLASQWLGATDTRLPPRQSLSPRPRLRSVPAKYPTQIQSQASLQFSGC